MAAEAKKAETVSNERTDWLRTLHDGWRSEIPTLFCVTVAGVRMIGATNGLAITLLRAQDDEIAAEWRPVQAHTAMLDGAAWNAVPAADLDAWLLRFDKRCEGCGGLGFVALHGYAAFGPDGEGPEHDLWAKCGCQRSGVLARVPVDRKLLMEFMGPLTSPTIEIASLPKKHMVALRSPDWLVIAMGLKAKPHPDVFPPVPAAPATPEDRDE